MGRGEKVVTTGIQDARENLRSLIEAAAQQDQHTVINRYGKPVAVLVPVTWYISKGGDPREPLDQIAEAQSKPKA